MSTVTKKTGAKVADEVWLIVALLHREQPSKLDFTFDEIMDRARREGIVEPLRPGFYIHVNQHCVANRPPNPGRYRMLYETAPSRRRLFREGDSYHPQREGSKTVPHPSDVPEEYRDLIDWYRKWTAAGRNPVDADPLLALAGSGRKLWADEHADEYVRRLREGW